MRLHDRLRLLERGPLGTGGNPAHPVAERGRLGEASTETPHRRMIQIITPGWGSSGYYSAEVLERAATERVIPAGTHMYLNHASESEHADRPERDVEKIAAVLVEDATWDGERLTAPADLVGPHAELIESLAPYIGVSISGSATDIVLGEAEGRRGPIIEGLAHVASVDFVTHAGRGGMVLLENARPSLVAARAVGRGVDEATVNDTRDALHQALRDTYAGEKTYVWVRDFDDTTVWFEVEDADSSGTYGQAYSQADSGAVALVGDWTEVRVRTEYVPVDTTVQVTLDPAMVATEVRRLVEKALAPLNVPVTRPDSTTTTTEADQEVTMGNIQIDEAEHNRLVEKAGRVDALEGETAQLRAREGARTFARTRTTTANAELAGPVVDRVVETAMASELPLTEAGALDETAFGARVDEARAAEEAYLGRLTGGTDGDQHRVSHLGHSTTTEEAVTESAPARSPWGRERSKGA